MIVRDKTIAVRLIRNFIIKIDLVKIKRYRKHEIHRGKFNRDTRESSVTDWLFYTLFSKYRSFPLDDDSSIRLETKRDSRRERDVAKDAGRGSMQQK